MEEVINVSIATWQAEETSDSEDPDALDDETEALTRKRQRDQDEKKFTGDGVVLAAGVKREHRPNSLHVEQLRYRELTYQNMQRYQ